MEHRLTDERLAWLAVREELAKRSKKGTLLARILHAMNGDRAIVVRGNGEGGEFGGSAHTEVLSERMQGYAFAVDDVASRLSPDDRRTLRETCAVPPWFLDAVQAQYARYYTA